MRLQRFHFRHTTPAFRTPLFNQWLARQPSHNEILHATQECDVCSTRFDEIENVALRNQLFLFQVLGSHYLKHIVCGLPILTTLRLHARWLDMLRLEWLMSPLTKTMPKRMTLIFNECLLGEIFLDFPYPNTLFACKDSILDKQRLHLEIHYLTNGWHANLLTMSFCTLPENVMYPFR